MNDQFKRRIDYLRVSVTDRCNLGCLYCTVPGNGDCQQEETVLSLDELFLLVECFVESGFKKVRITGGEPLVRKGLTGFLRKISGLEDLSDLSLTTNGILLDRFAAELKVAGIRRINVSLDSLTAEKYWRITGGGELDQVQRGIEEALDIGLSPVRINTVVMRGINDDELVDFARLSVNKPVDVRFIEIMPMGGNLQIFSATYLGSEAMKAIIMREFPLNEVMDDSERGPATYYRIPGALGKIGFISPVSHSFCHLCNRMRLTANGDLRPCLALDTKFSFRELVHTKDKAKIKEQIKEMVRVKPAGHEWGLERFSTRPMFQIGG